ncbi:MAG: hypothetical protein AAF721_17905 [Myxococcota bacterium]
MASKAALGAWLALPGCGDPAPAAGSGETGNGGSTSAVAGDSEGSDDADSSGGDSTGLAPPPSACVSDTTISAAPQTIGQAVDFINALPHPVTLDCFLERLERPLVLNGTTSTVSLQPADGARSPRMFLFYGDLIMSVAVDGDPGRTLLEFGELVAETKSIKGELEFPIEETIPDFAPMERVFDGEGSECRICHGGESEAPEYEMAFASDALQFREVEDVPLEDIQAEHAACNPAVEPERCRRLDSLLSFGSVEAGAFPEALQTIYDYE